MLTAALQSSPASATLHLVPVLLIVAARAAWNQSDPVIGDPLADVGKVALWVGYGSRDGAIRIALSLGDSSNARRVLLTAPAICAALSSGFVPSLAATLLMAGAVLKACDITAEVIKRLPALMNVLMQCDVGDEARVVAEHCLALVAMDLT
jgi:hypothetical protein